MATQRPVFGSVREWVVDLMAVTALGVFLGMIGPFGSFYGAPVGVRIAYWVANLWIGFAVLSTIVRLAMRGAARLDLPVWLVIVAAVAVGALPLSIILDLFAALVWPPAHGHTSGLVPQYGSVLTISEPFALGFFFLSDRGRRTAAQACGEAERERPPRLGGTIGTSFLDRLPSRLGRHLLCLRMEDHYVRAHTALGSDLILTPLKDAMAELAGVDGLQVHRSWWVAREAVTASRRRGRNLALVLVNGLEAPVSRAYVAKLRAAGWLER